MQNASSASATCLRARAAGTARCGAAPRAPGPAPAGARGGAGRAGAVGAVAAVGAARARPPHRAPRSASEKTATVGMPSRVAVASTRHAISPRLAWGRAGGGGGGWRGVGGGALAPRALRWRGVRLAPGWLIRHARVRSSRAAAARPRRAAAPRTTSSFNIFGGGSGAGAGAAPAALLMARFDACGAARGRSGAPPAAGAAPPP